MACDGRVGRRALGEDEHRCVWAILGYGGTQPDRSTRRLIYTSSPLRSPNSLKIHVTHKFWHHSLRKLSLMFVTSPPASGLPLPPLTLSCGWLFRPGGGAVETGTYLHLKASGSPPRISRGGSIRWFGYAPDIIDGTRNLPGARGSWGFFGGRGPRGQFQFKFTPKFFDRPGLVIHRQPIASVDSSGKTASGICQGSNYSIGHRFTNVAYFVRDHKSKYFDADGLLQCKMHM